MTPFSEDLTAFYQDGEAAEVYDSAGVRWLGHLSRPFGQAVGIDGHGPQLVSALADLPGGFGSGSLLSVGSRHYRAKRLRPDGTGIVGIDLEETQTRAMAHLEVTGDVPDNPLLIGGTREGGIDFNFRGNPVPIGSVFGMPNLSAEIDRMIQDGMVRRLVPTPVPGPGPTGGPWRLYVCLEVVNLNGYGTPERYAEIPAGSVLSLPPWGEMIDHMIDEEWIQAL